MQNGTNVPASLGGPKLIGVNLRNVSKKFTPIVSPPNVVYPDSVSNRSTPLSSNRSFVFSASTTSAFIFAQSVTSSGPGVAYITDSSMEGRNGLIIP